MKKLVIGIVLSSIIISSTFIGVFATHDTDPHSVNPSQIIITILSNDTDPH